MPLPDLAAMVTACSPTWCGSAAAVMTPACSTPTRGCSAGRLHLAAAVLGDLVVMIADPAELDPVLVTD